MNAPLNNMTQHPEEPPWAAAPLDNTWSLTEIKQGVTVAQHPLQRPCTFLGRAADPIALAHESCSRFHARLAFDASQTLWLRDLGSTHGTFCNKRKLPPQACGKQESSSTKAGVRGVMVSPGDVLQFGASTRIYCVEGPQKSMLPLPPSVALIPPPEQAANDNNNNSPSTTEQIPEKYQKEFEQIQALRYKLANIQQESDRIRQKGLELLTQGQEKQLQKNQQRETELQESIAEKQEELDRKMAYSSQNNNTHHVQKADMPVDEEEVDDRTERHVSNDHELNPDGETEDSLQSKWSALHAELIRVVEQVELIQTKLVKLQQRMEKCKENKDDDIFFLQNDMQMDVEQKELLLTKKKELDERLLEVEKLLKIVDPKWNAKREAIETSPSVPTLPSSNSSDQAKEEDTWIMPAVPVAIPVVASMPPQESVTTQASRPSMPPPPTEVTESSSMQPPQSAFTQVESSLEIVSRPAKRQKGPSMPPPSVLVSNPTKPVTLNNEADVWRPPKGQDGSGRSKLNDKFGGKY